IPLQLTAVQRLEPFEHPHPETGGVGHRIFRDELDGSRAEPLPLALDRWVDLGRPLRGRGVDRFQALDRPGKGDRRANLAANVAAGTRGDHHEPIARREVFLINLELRRLGNGLELPRQILVGHCAAEAAGGVPMTAPSTTQPSGEDEGPAPPRRLNHHSTVRSWCGRDSSRCMPRAVAGDKGLWNSGGAARKRRSLDRRWLGCGPPPSAPPPYG